MTQNQKTNSAKNRPQKSRFSREIRPPAPAKSPKNTKTRLFSRQEKFPDRQKTLKNRHFSPLPQTAFLTQSGTFPAPIEK
ncbi:MAG: hypothetical protein IT426_06505 [Pirellulales bacterium]|nr:hypothetical protein [Pirellulales bacterium]